MNRNQTPLFHALYEYSRTSKYSFHVPGHKDGRVFPILGRNLFQPLLSIDATELTGLDDLHNPEGAILDAQRLTAEFYGVQNSYFLIGGSTVGNLTMIMAACNKGETVLVQKNCHKSVLNGMELARVNPVFLTPEIDKVGQVPGGVSIEVIKEAIAKYPEATALVLTNPNYYGMAFPLREIIEVAHKKGLTVLVDEAHGAHFCLGDPFPRSAILDGADMVVHSAHKSLPAMTMGSYLHINSNQIDKEKVEKYLGMFQSSSPSYPIMASLDLARYYLSQLTKDNILEIVWNIEEFKKAISGIGELFVLNEELSTFIIDPLKITVQSKLQRSGFELQHIFEKSGIFTELADPLNVLFVMPLAPFDYEEVVEKIHESINSLDMVKDQVVLPIQQNTQKLSSLMISYEEMKHFGEERIPLQHALGKICAEMIVPYPPGIPLVMKGEMISEQHLKQIFSLKKYDAKFQNSDELWRTGIKVYKV